jgi:hypothetical protein
MPVTLEKIGEVDETKKRLESIKMFGGLSDTVNF